MGAMPKFSKAVWKRTTSEGCTSCSGQLEIAITNGGDSGSIRIFAEGTGLQVGTKIYDAPYTLAKGATGTWSFKVPYWGNKSPSVKVRTGPAGSIAWTDEKTLTPG